MSGMSTGYAREVAALRRENERLRGELPPAVREVLELCRDVVPFARGQSFVRTSDLVASIDALLGKQEAE